MAQLFNRNKNHTTIAELEEYYASKNKNTGSLKAWFMAFLSLFITAAVIIALFFGARWLWNALFNNDKDVATQTTTGQEVRILEDGTVVGDVNNLNNSANGSSASSSSDKTTSGGGVVSDEAASTTRDAAATSQTNRASETATPTQASSPTNTTTQSNAATSNVIPNTGPASILYTLIIGLTVVAGYIAARVRYTSR